MNGEYVIIPGEGTSFVPKYISGKFGLHQRAYAVHSNDVYTKYLYYFLLNRQEEFKKWAIGSTVPSLRKFSFNWIKEQPFPTKSEQKEIIDIIEPLDNVINSLLSLQMKIGGIIQTVDMITNLKNDLMWKNCKFIKGRIPKKGEGYVPFLNVSAANGKVNRFVNNTANVKNGDITISLDGTCGLVNNMLEGFNGYLYKVESNIYDHHEIYYSLLTKLNQDIIKQFSFGTTIKHASRAIKHLRIFKLPKEFKEIYELEKLVRTNLFKLEDIKSRMIKYLL